MAHRGPQMAFSIHVDSAYDLGIIATLAHFVIDWEEPLADIGDLPHALSILLMQADNAFSSDEHWRAHGWHESSDDKHLRQIAHFCREIAATVEKRIGVEED